MIFLLLTTLVLSAVVMAAPLWTTPHALNATVFNATEAYQHRVTVTGSASQGVNALWIANNRTGTWKNYTTGECILSGKNFTTWTDVRLNCSLGNSCGFDYQSKIYFNDTAGAENVTSGLSFRIYPYINYTTNYLANISSTSCEDKNNISVTSAGSDPGALGFLMPYMLEDTTERCSFEASDVFNITIYNETSYCYVEAVHGKKSSGDVMKIFKTEILRVVPPPSLPAALTAAAVGIIILVVTIVSKAKSKGWT